jgi:hypothetical protein
VQPLPPLAPPPPSAPSHLPRILGVTGSAPSSIADGVPGISSDEHETKFAFPTRLLPRVLGTLRARCQPDGRYAFGIVRSIYFDTHRWQAVDEKLNSDFLKTKIRLRHYGVLPRGEPVGTCFLEAKFKIGSCRRKLRIHTDLSASSAMQLTLNGPELARIPELLSNEATGFKGSIPGPLLPVFEIEYKRWRFVEPRSGARLSIDTEIRVSRVNPGRLPAPRTLALPTAVLEVKGDFQALPTSLGDLNALGCKRTAFSKYGVCHGWLRQAAL